MAEHHGRDNFRSQERNVEMLVDKFKLKCISWLEKMENIPEVMRGRWGE